jgi:hypothetical protein
MTGWLSGAWAMICLQREVIRRMGNSAHLSASTVN